MTVLSACQSAAIRLVGKKPTTVFSSQDVLEMELADLSTETAKAIAEEHDWRALIRFATITGNGSRIAHDLPSDYDRMPIKGDMHAGSWETWRYTPARDLDQWLDIQTSLSTLNPGFWMLLEGKMQVYPAIPSAELAKYPYVSKNFALADSGAGKSSFTKDEDTFVLSERLLVLGLIWRWRAQKRLEYAEDMRNYEIALAQEIGRDKGARILRSGKRRGSFDVGYAYPKALGQ